MNLYIKLFLAISIPFGISIGLYSHSPIFGLFMGLFVGIFWTFILGYLQRQSVTRIVNKISNDTLDVRQKRDFDLDLAFDKVYELCLQSIHIIRRCRIKMEDRIKGRIDARTGKGWSKSPCVISYRLHKIDNKRTHIEITSRPFIPTTIIDLGSSLENVETISRFLKEHGSRFYANHV